MVQFYPWFKFSFLLFQTHYHVIIIHYHTQKQKKRKFEPRIKLNHNIYITQLLLIIIYIKDHFSFTSSHLSSLCVVAHKAFTESLHLSRLTATVFPSSHDGHSASALFFFNCSLPGGVWSSSSSFFFWCPSYCYVAIVVLVLSQYMFNHPPSTLLHPFTHRFHVCSV